MDQFCTNCGNRIGPDGRCTVCGAFAPGAPTVPAAPAAPVKTKSKKPILILAAAVVGVILLGLAVFFLGRAFGLFGAGPGNEPGVKLEDTLDPVTAEEYFGDMGVITGRKSAKDAGMKTEAEALKSFADRGFGDLPVTACFDADGGYIGETEISAAGSDRHPFYEMNLATPDGAYWTVVLMGDAFYADPVSFNAQSGWDAPCTLSESGVYQVYDDQKNEFCTIELNGEGRVLKRVDRIDAEMLNGLDAWEVSEL